MGGEDEVDQVDHHSVVRQLGEISCSLWKMALELDVPVIALAQLNRAIEHDATLVPRFSDLLESDSI